MTINPLLVDAERILSKLQSVPLQEGAEALPVFYDQSLTLCVFAALAGY